MGRTRPRFESLREAEASASKILAGGQRADARRILELIHTINPTGRDLNAHERSRRYALKSRLQSLLVREHGSELRVVLDTASPGAVSLRHRTLGLDACHALLAELDADARAWVQLQLDLGADAEPTGETPARAVRAARRGSSRRDATSDDRLARARTAAEGFDYDLARALYLEAFDGPDAADAAAALMELLVEQLGDVAAALALEPRIPPTARERPEVKALLALALARTGDPAALQWAEGLGPVPHAAVYVALLEAAVGDRREVDARRLLASMRSAELDHPMLAKIAVEIEQLGASVRAPMEREAEALLGSGRESDAESLARRVLDEWPASSVARGVIKSIHRARREREVRALHERVVQSIESSQTDAARRALESLRALDAVDPALESRVEALERAEASAHTAKRIESVLAMAARGGALDRVLEAYAALDEDARARVRAETAVAALELYEQVRNRNRGTRPAVRIAGVMAIVAAERLLAAGDPANAAKELDAYDRALSATPATLTLRRAIDRAQAQARRREAHERLERAAQRLDAGDATGAERTLATVAQELLGDEDLVTLSALRARASERLEVDRHRTALAAARARADHDAVLLNAEWLLAAHSDGEAEWSRARDEAIDALSREVMRYAVRGPVETGMLGRSCSSLLGVENWLSDDGEELYLPFRELHTATLFVFDVRAGTVKHSLALTMEGFGLRASFVDADTVSMLSGTGEVLSLERETFRVRRRRPLGTGSVDFMVIDALAVPDCDVWWIRSGSRRLTQLRITAFNTRRWERISSTNCRWTSVVQSGEPWVAFSSDDKVLTAHRADGRGVDEFGLRENVTVVGLHPSGVGYVGFTTLAPGERVEGDTAWLVDWDPERGRSGDGVRIGMDAAIAHASIVTARGAGCAFVITRREKVGTQEVVAIASHEGSLTELYRFTLPTLSAIAVDRHCRRAVAVYWTASGLRCVELGRSAPAIEWDGTEVHPMRRAGAAFGREHQCICDEEIMASVAGAIKGLDVAGMTTWLRQTVRHADDPSENMALLVCAAAARVSRDDLGALEPVFASIASRHPRMALAHAHVLFRLARDRDARARLEELARADDADEHVFHLLGLVTFYLGDRNGALVALGAGAARSQRCPVVDTMAVLEPGSQPQAPRPASVIDPLVAAVRACDACLAARDWEGAIRTLDVPMVFEAMDAQSAVRLACAHWYRGARTVAEEFAMDLAFDLLTMVPEPRRCIAETRAWWSASTIASMRSKCTRWLLTRLRVGALAAEDRIARACAAASEALQRGDRDAARRWVELLEREACGAEQRRGLEPVRAFAEGLPCWRARAALADALAQEGKMVLAAMERFGAWRMADDDGRAEAREAWERSRRDVSESLGVRVSREVRECVVGASAFGLESDSMVRLDPAGSTFVVVECAGKNVRLQFIDTDDGLPRETVFFESPFEFEKLRTFVTEDRLWFMTESAQLFALSRSTWELAAIAEPSSWTDDEVIGRSYLAPDCNSLWFTSTVGGVLRYLWVVDLETLDVRHPIPSVRVCYSLYRRTGGSMVAVCGESDRQSIVCGSDGTPHEPRRWLPADATRVLGACDGLDGLLEVVEEPAPKDSSRPSSRRWLLRIVATDGTIRPLATLEAPGSARFLAAEVLPTDSMVFVLLDATGESPREMAAYRLSPSGATLAWRCGMPAETRFVRDASGRALYAVTIASGRFRSIRLTANPPPSLEGDRYPFGIDDVEVAAPFACRSLDQATLEQLSNTFASSIAKDIDVVRMVRETEKDAKARWVADSTVRWMLRDIDSEDAVACAEKFLSIRPESAFARRSAADLYAAAGRWTDVLRALDGMADASLGRHGLHLRGVASYWLGRVDEACDAWRRGVRFDDDRCDLDRCLALAELRPPEGPLERDGFFQVLASVVEADRRFDAGDRTGALEVLRRPESLWTGDSQVLARLVAWILDGGVRTADDACVLRAAFHDLDANVEPTLPHVLGTIAPRRSMWDAERLQSVTARARAWLDADEAPGFSVPGAR